MKAVLQFTGGFVTSSERDWTSYEKVEGDQVTVEGVEKVTFGAGLVLERGELVFYYDDKFLVNFVVEPEALRTKLKGEANAALAALQDCDRCRAGDVLLPCACHQWCGNDKCMSDDGRVTVDLGPRVESPWDEETGAKEEWEGVFDDPK